MPDQLRLINMDAPWRRLLLLVPVALALMSVWVVARWCIANTLATYPPDAETVRRASRLAPADPQVHYTLAAFAEKSFEPEELNEAARQYEEAAQLSPYDYRLWMKLGRAREMSGDVEGGERALRRAVSLAPNYVMPRWFLGNLLLRSGRQEEAFAELRRAAEADPTLRPQIFAALWSLFRGDAGQIAAAVGDTHGARAQLAEYLVRMGRADEAHGLWSELSVEERRAERAAGEALMRGMIEAKRFRAAHEIYRDLAPADAAPPAAGQVANGGFESDITPAGRNRFDWQIVPIEGAQMGLDARNMQSGQRSLRILFSAQTNLPFANVAQLVVVEPQARYRLEFFARTEQLRSISTPYVGIVDAADPTRGLGDSSPLPAGTHDWQRFAVDFVTPAQLDGVVVVIGRSKCTEEVCPISGRVWYDDFNLQRLDGSSGKRGGNSNGVR